MTSRHKLGNRRHSNAENGDSADSEFLSLPQSESQPNEIKLVGTYMQTGNNHKNSRFNLKLSKIQSSTTTVQKQAQQRIQTNIPGDNKYSSVEQAVEVSRLRQQVLDLEFRQQFRSTPTIIESKPGSSSDMCNQTESATREFGTNTEEVEPTLVILDPPVCVSVVETELKMKIEQLQQELSMKTLQYDALLESSDQCNSRYCALQDSLQVEENKTLKLTDQTIRLEKCVEKLNTAVCDCEVEHMTEINNIKKEFQKVTEKMESAFKVELDKLNESLLESEVMQKNLIESKLNSAIRLCVVAPPIHLHIKSLPEPLNFSPPIDVESISEFMRSQIHPQLCNLFIQSNTAEKEFKNEVKAWIENKISSLEESIERHVIAAYSTSSK